MTAEGLDQSGQDQVQTVGLQLDKPLRTQVILADGTPVGGTTVAFQVVNAPKKARGWSLESQVTTDSLGIAETMFRIGDKTGTYVVEARLLDGKAGTDEVFFEVIGRASTWIAKLIMGLLGGLGMFLYGMRIMSDGLKRSAGSRMRFILRALTVSRFRGLIAGAFVTTVIQSSSATTVMLVSFVEAGLIKFPHTLGVILGADIGTTITAQIIAFKVTDLALLLVAGGFALRLFAKKESLQAIGEAILGFGLVFNGMNLMSKAMIPLRAYQPFIDMLTSLEYPLLGIIAGTALTAILQSSSAVTGIIIVLGQQGLLTLDAAIPMILGANIGTTITAGLASLGGGREAKRVAVAHTFFKIGGVLLFLFWIPSFADLVRGISPGPPEGTSLIAAQAAVVPRQIANAHTIFNVGLAFVFFPFAGLMARQITRLLPDTPVPPGIKPAVAHLDSNLIKTPDLALNMARAEVVDMTELVKIMLGQVIIPFEETEEPPDPYYPDLKLIEGIQMREKKVDYLDEQISVYLFEISRGNLTNEQANESYALVSIVHDLEAIGDVIDKSLAPLARKTLALGVPFSEEGKAELQAYHTKAMKQLSRCKDAITEMDPTQASKIIAKGITYLSLKAELKRTHFERVRLGHEPSIATDEIHVEMMEDLKKINDHAANIANTILEAVDPQKTRRA
jgi:phosphate:Na+ symporter